MKNLSRRRFQRYSMNSEIPLEITSPLLQNEVVRGEILDISVNGLNCLVDSQVPVNEKAKIKFTLTQNESKESILPYDLNGNFVWAYKIKDNLHRCGINFVSCDDSNDFARKIEEFLETKPYKPVDNRKKERRKIKRVSLGRRAVI